MTVTRTHVYPEGTPPGVYTITATDGVNTATAQITILNATPSVVAVDPTLVGPGDIVAVSGSGFPADTAGTVDIVPAAGGASVGTASFTTDETGAMPATSVTVADTAAPGAYTVNVQVGTVGGQAELTVAAPLPTPAGLEVTGTGEASIDLAWEAVTGADEYLVEYREEGAATWLAGPEVSGVSATVSGLSAGTAYELRVTAKDTTGASADSDPSAPVTATTASPLPQLAFPDDVAAAPLGEDGLTVTWAAREGAVGYVVHYRLQGETAWTALPQTTETSQDITGLEPLTAYEVQVQAVGDDTTNTSSVFGPTPPVEQSTAGAQLPVPTGAALEAESTTAVTMRWDAVPDATAYRVQYKTTTATEWTVVSPDTAETEESVSDLTAGESYELRVQAVGDGTTVADSEYTEPLVMNMVQLEAPTGLASPAQTDTSIDVTWTAVENAGGYVVEWIAAGGSGAWEQENTPTASHTIAGLEPDTEYNVSVMATAADYVPSELSEVSTFTTLVVLAVPTNVSTSGETTDSVDLDWDAVSGAVAYHVQYRQGTAGTWLDWEPQPTTNTVTVTGLASGSNYEFQVKAVGDGTTTLDSGYSDVVNAATL